MRWRSGWGSGCATAGAVASLLVDMDQVVNGTIDEANGSVTLDQLRAVVHSNTSNPDDSTSLTADNLVTLTAGLGTHVDNKGSVAAAYTVNTEELTAWRTGKLVFNNALLGEVAREVSRYRERPLRVSTPAVGNLRLTSVFKANDTDALLKALPHILPVALRTLPDGSQEIISR